MKYTLMGLILGILLFSSFIWARGFDFNIEREYRQYADSLDKAPLEVREYFQSKYHSERLSVRDSLNVRCVGRWPFGPSWVVEPSDHIDTDSLMFLGSGSGIRILKVSNPQLPQMISKIDASSEIADGAGIKKKDSLLYVLTYASNLEIYTIADPYHPRRLGIFPFPNYCRGMAIKDSFVLVVGYDSLLRVINCANPSNIHQVDSLRTPDYGRAVDIQGNYAYVAASLSGLRIVDISNPNDIQEVSSIGGWRGYDVLVDGNYAYVSTGAGGLRIVNITNPLLPQQVGSLTSTPAARIYKKSFFVYAVTSDGNSSNFFIVDVSNPSFPILIESTSTSGWGYDVCVLSPYTYAYTADDWEGIHIIDITNPTNPQVDTALYAADVSYDIVVDNSKAYIANNLAGLKIIDVSYPSSPFDLGSYDTIGQIPFMKTVVAKDSFAFIPWFGNPWMRVVDVIDPTNPRLAGFPDSCQAVSEDMIIRDTFLYIAADYRFLIYNIAHPRQPRLVGSCNLPTGSAGLCIQDTFAYVAPDLHIVNISNPANPRLISRTPCNCWKVEVHDTFAYISHAYESLLIYSVANPLSPYEIGWASIHGQGYDVVVKGNFAYVGCYDFRVFDISNPTNPRLVGYYTTPDRVRRVFADSQYIYAACFSAGVCIFDYYPHGIEETESKNTFGLGISFYPNPAGTKCYLNLTSTSNEPISVKIYNTLGQKLKEIVFEVSGQTKKYKQEVSLNDLQDGVLFLQVRQGTNNRLFKVMKVTGR